MDLLGLGGNDGGNDGGYGAANETKADNGGSLLGLLGLGGDDDKPKEVGKTVAQEEEEEELIEVEEELNEVEKDLAGVLEDLKEGGN